MTYPYGTHGAPAVGGGLPGLPRRDSSSEGPPRGESIFAIPGTHYWTAPKGVYSVCVVCVGSGSNGRLDGSTRLSGGGGALAWANDIPVVPGETYEIIVGGWGRNNDEGAPSSAFGRVAPGGNASATKSGLPYGEVGSSRGGGRGGAGRSAPSGGVGGGGAGGYSGDGGDGDNLGIVYPGSGGAAAGGQRGSSTGQAGGGVGLYGEGSSGESGGEGGSGGQSTFSGGTNRSAGGVFGGGGGSTGLAGAVAIGGHGAVRIVWGEGRAFPSTDVGPTY